MGCIFIYLFLNLLYVPGVTATEECGELQFVAVVYRHGDRAPLSPYPKDPHHSETCWPNGWGQLTNLGKLQQFELGKWLRNRYCRFLPRDYNPRDIYVLSSDVDRTLISAYSNLAGLYEEWMKENKVEQLEWISIPVHTIPRDLDPLVAARKHCPLYHHLMEELMNSEEVEVVNDYYRELFDAISEHTGERIKTVADVTPIYGTLNVENMNGFQLPSWTKAAFPEPMKEIAEFTFQLPCSTMTMKRLKCGPLVKDIVKHIEDKKDGRITQKLWMYSGHDSTVANLMQCLNVYDGILPPYTAMLIFELFRRGSEWWVRLSYKTPTTIQVLRIPRCDRLCPFASFKKLVKPVVPVDWEAECQNVPKNSS